MLDWCFEGGLKWMHCKPWKVTQVWLYYLKKNVFIQIWWYNLKHHFHLSSMLWRIKYSGLFSVNVNLHFETATQCDSIQVVMFAEVTMMWKYVRSLGFMQNFKIRKKYQNSAGWYFYGLLDRQLNIPLQLWLEYEDPQCPTFAPFVGSTQMMKLLNKSNNLNSKGDIDLQNCFQPPELWPGLSSVVSEL